MPPAPYQYPKDEICAGTEFYHGFPKKHKLGTSRYKINTASIHNMADAAMTLLMNSPYYENGVLKSGNAT